MSYTRPDTELVRMIAENETARKFASRHAPTAANIGVTAATGSHDAGRLAAAAAGAAREVAPEPFEKAAGLALGIAVTVVMASPIGLVIFGGAAIAGALMKTPENEK